MRFHLTERFVRSRKAESGDLQFSGTTSSWVSDFRPSQMAVRVSPLDYVIDGRRRRMFIGDHPDWTATAAREEARRQKREIGLGHDPLAARDGRRTTPTMAELIERYIDEHGARLSPDHARDQRNMLRNYVLPAWGNRKVSDIRTSDVDYLLAKIARGRARPGGDEEEARGPARST
jgi:hypothetical protein